MKKIDKIVIISLILVSVLLLSISTSGLCANEVIKWRLQSTSAAGDVGFQGAVRFAELVNKASDGRLKIEPFSAGAIVPAGEEFAGVMAGSVELAQVPAVWGAGYIPEGLFFGGGWPDCPTADQIMLWMHYEGIKLAQELYEPIGLHCVGLLTVFPPEVWCHSKKPLKSIEDIKGLKIRLGTAPLNAIFKKMGATPVFLPGGEVYESMQRGVIDACELSTASVNWGLGLQEVADYMYLSSSRAPTDAYTLFVNKKKWDALSSDLQMIIEMAASMVSQEFLAARVNEESVAIEKFKEYGIKVEKLPEDIDELLREKAKEYIIQECAKNSNMEKIYKHLVQYKEKCNLLGLK